MIKSVIAQIGNLPTYGGLGNVLCCSVGGNVAMLSNNRIFIIGSSSVVDNNVVITKELHLALSNGRRMEFASEDFNNIAFNADGTMLVVWFQVQQPSVINANNKSKGSSTHPNNIMLWTCLNL